MKDDASSVFVEPVPARPIDDDAAMARRVSGAPLPLTADPAGGRLVVRGRVPWASNRLDYAQLTATILVIGVLGMSIDAAARRALSSAPSRH